MNLVDSSILADDPLLRKVWSHLGRPENCSVVGGYVRDRLLGRPSNDLDLVLAGNDETTAISARRLARSLGVRAHLIGTPPHRIWRIETSELKIELWPLGELSQDDDIRRRDFTCNALSWGLPHGPLVDRVEGFEDIQQRRLRAVSRANLEDDPIRLLRATRFLAQLDDFQLEAVTRAWIVELAPSLVRAPRERVGQELLSLLRAPAASRGLSECLELGLFEPAAPAAYTIDVPWILKNLDTIDVLNSDPNAGGTPVPHKPAGQRIGVAPPARDRSGDTLDAARLALLVRAWGLPSESDIAPYAWPKPIRENARLAAAMFGEALATVEAPAADRRELAWRAGQAFPALIALASVLEPRASGWTRWWRQWRRSPESFLDPQPLLNGLEIADAAGIATGPELGAVANALLRAQIRGEVRSRCGAVRWLERHTDPR